MSKLLFILFTLLSTTLFSQVDKHIVDSIKDYPTSFSSIEKLGEKIDTDFTSRKDKAAAIFTWIALNIKYDTRSFFSSSKPKEIRFSYRTEEERLRKEQQIRRKTAKKALSKKKAVCQGYSELYRQLCLLCDIECEVISGYSRTMARQIGKKLNQPDHAWNAIKLNNQWHLLDVTWAAGSVDMRRQYFIPGFSPEYFCMSPNLFFLNHYPKDERWLLSKNSKQQFIDLPIFYRSYFNSNSKIISPKNGLITKIKNGLIQIELITNKPLNSFSYQFSTSRYSQKAEGRREGEKLIIDVPANNIKSAFLNIFYNNEIFFSYKIEIK